MRKHCFSICWFGNGAPNNLFGAGLHMDLALADSLLHLNDGKSGHAGIFLSRWDWMLSSILTIIIGRTTSAEYVPALKRTWKKKERLDNLKGQKERTRKTITNWWKGLSIVHGLCSTNINKFD